MTEQLTAAERRRLAEFLGWQYIERGQPPMVWYCDTTPQGLWLPVLQWHPDTNWAQAGMVADALTSKGVEWSMANDNLPDDEPRGYVGKYFRNGKAVPEAFCRAALAWLDSQKDKANGTS